MSSRAAAWSEGCLTLNCGRMWNVWLEKGLGRALIIFLEQAYYSVVFPMYGEAMRAGRIPQEAGEMGLRLLSV